MVEYVILFRTHGGAVDFVRDDRNYGTDVAVYPDEESAIKDTETRKLFKAVPFQIVKLDEL